MRKLNIFYTFLFFGFIFFIFRNWFLAPQIIGGDWPFFFDETFKNYSFFFSSWNPFQGNGLGGTAPFYSLGIFHGFTVFLSQTLHISWPVTYKFSWFGLFIGLSVFSSMYLLKVVLPRANFLQQIFASIVFSTNTYILMVVSGGQMGVALAYSMAPLVLAIFMRLIINLVSDQLNLKLSVLGGLALAIQVMFDPRIAYLTIIAVLIYLAFNIKRGISNIFFLLFYSIVIPIGVTILLHAVWIVPLISMRINPISALGDAYTGTGIVRFLSFAHFSHAFSLLHPNWPENIFGKTYFIKPEFILLPIIAYSSLLFTKKREILFFALLGIVGSFLAKGANPPFGGIYLWLFESIPGFVMFRDPTKFYLLIAMSYSILMPLSIYSIYRWLRSKQQLRIQNFLSYLFLLFIFSYLIFLVNPAIFGRLGGTFKGHEVPKEYVELKDFLNDQKEYFRTLWVPRQQRFSFISDVHPAMEAEPLFGTRSAEEIFKNISSEQGQLLLSELSVKYVLVQYDSLGEQFLEDRKYSEKQRIGYERVLDAIPSLKKIQSGKIAVYETPYKNDHFSLDKMGKISVIIASPMHYILTVSIDQPQNLIFSEGYSPYWVLKRSQKAISSKKTKNGLNSFMLDQKGKYIVDISFSLDKYYEYGRIISFLTLIALTACFISYRKK
ncbi:MAG: hypothetical protein Q7K54_04335 [Candidatus Parcubacteria bacterium]|nr:hypothetical protein [Candidatus Parcubacteria bacterium]